VKTLKYSFEELINLPSTVYRDVPGRKTFRFEHEGQAYFAKCHSGIGWREILKNLIQFKLPVISAKTEERAIERANNLGVKTPEVAGFSQQGFNPAKIKSFIITRELRDMPSLEETFPTVASERFAVIKNIAKISRNLHQGNMVHRDLYLCHFLRDEKDLYLIDLHRAKFIRFRKQRWILNDLAKLYFSCMSMPFNQRDVLRFLKAYYEAPLRNILSERGNELGYISNRAETIYERDFGQKPFQAFNLSIEGSIVRCDERVRFVPGRRAVFFGTWNKRAVVVKQFIHPRKAHRDVRRELAGYQLLKNAGLNTPEVLFSNDSLVIFEKIEGQKITEPLDKVIECLKTLHNNNLCQTDCHPDNFIMKGEDVYILDCSSIKRNRSPKAHQYNLDLFASQFERNDSSCRTEAERRRVDRINRKRSKRYLSKMLRSSTDNVFIKKNKQKILCKRNRYAGQMLGALNDIEAFMTNNECVQIKDGNTCSVFKVKVNDEWVVVKRYNNKGLLFSIKNYFRKSRAIKSWLNAHRLKMNNISTADPAAVIERREGLFFKTSYYISSFVEGKSLYHSALDNHSVSALGEELFGQFKIARIVHGDMKSLNFIVVDGRLVVLDLDAMRVHRNKLLFERGHRKDQERFRKSPLPQN